MWSESYHNKGKGSSFSPEGTAINGSRRCALYPPWHCQCSVLRVFKAIATRTRGKSKQTLKSLKIEPGTSRSESRALANWATTAPSYHKQRKILHSRLVLFFALTSNDTFPEFTHLLVFFAEKLMKTPKQDNLFEKLQVLAKLMIFHGFSRNETPWWVNE